MVFIQEIDIKFMSKCERKSQRLNIIVFKNIIEPNN